MDWLTFAAICIVVIPWQVLAFIIVNAIITYMNSSRPSSDCITGLSALIDHVQKNPSAVWQLVTEWLGIDKLTAPNHGINQNDCGMRYVSSKITDKNSQTKLK